MKNFNELVANPAVHWTSNSLNKSHIDNYQLTEQYLCNI